MTKNTLISKETVDNTASLARLEFNAEESERLAKDLNAILSYIDQLKEVDVTGVQPLENINEDVETASLRTDETRESVTRDEALRNAPKSADGYFLVPKVIGGEPDPS